MIEVSNFDEASNKIGENLFSEIMRVEREAWPKEIRASLKSLQSRAETFAQGFLLGFVDNKLWGVSTAEIIDFDPANPCTSWEKITDNGLIKKTHKPRGNALYVISVGVSRQATRRGIGSALLAEQKNVGQRFSLRWLVLGSRVPGFACWHQQHQDSSLKDYLKQTNKNGESLDPLIRFYGRAGLKIIKLVPNYMEDDPESENFGVIMALQIK